MLNNMLTTFLLLNLFTPIQPPVFDIQEVLSNLAYCESSGNPKAYRANDGGSPSIGLFQFKQTTWDWALKRYKYENTHFIETKKGNLISPGDGIWDIMNPEHQKIIAKAIIEDGRASTTWKNCWRRINQ